MGGFPCDSHFDVQDNPLHVKGDDMIHLSRIARLF